MLVGQADATYRPSKITATTASARSVDPVEDRS